MLRPFALLNTEPKTPEGRNWRTFDENSKTITYGSGELTITSPVNSPLVEEAFFTLYGPLVFFMMRIDLAVNDGWSAGSKIVLPFGAVYTGASKTPAMRPLFQVYSSGGVPITTAYINLGSDMVFVGAYTNLGVLSENVFVQGWYYRN